MRRSERLQVVLDQETRREQAALEVMQQARARLDQEQGQLNELRRYHGEYQDEMRQTSRGRVAVSRLQSLQYLISQLDSAMNQQQRQISKAEAEFMRCREAWRKAYERREGMSRYIQTCRQREQYEDDRQEQKAVDEAASLRFARRRPR